MSKVPESWRDKLFCTRGRGATKNKIKKYWFLEITSQLRHYQKKNFSIKESLELLHVTAQGC